MNQTTHRQSEGASKRERRNELAERWVGGSRSVSDLSELLYLIPSLLHLSTIILSFFPVDSHIVFPNFLLSSPALSFLSTLLSWCLPPARPFFSLRPKTLLRQQRRRWQRQRQRVLALPLCLTTLPCRALSAPFLAKETLTVWLSAFRRLRALAMPPTSSFLRPAALLPPTQRSQLSVTVFRDLCATRRRRRRYNLTCQLRDMP